VNLKALEVQKLFSCQNTSQHHYWSPGQGLRTFTTLLLTLLNELLGNLQLAEVQKQVRSPTHKQARATAQCSWLYRTIHGHKQSAEGVFESAGAQCKDSAPQHIYI
jgi:hypothetical protein